MNPYQEAKIYQIISPSNPELVYYGSTTQTLKQRFYRHKKDNSYSSKEIMQYADTIIELVEHFPCETKKELLERERWYIENNPCVNMLRPIVTKEEEKEKTKEWFKKNYEEHKEEIKQKVKEYQVTHKEVIAERRKKYYEEHKEEINAKKKELYKEKGAPTRTEEQKEAKKQYQAGRVERTLELQRIRRAKTQLTPEEKKKISDYNKARYIASKST